MHVLVYDDVQEMRRAADQFNTEAGPHDQAVGVTHAYVDRDGRAGLTLVRLWRERLGTLVVSHEVHHAATALYGATLNPDVVAADVLTHHNEEFAHLYSDLLGKLVDRLYDLGYYSS